MGGMEGNREGGMKSSIPVENRESSRGTLDHREWPVMSFLGDG